MSPLAQLAEGQVKSLAPLVEGQVKSGSLLLFCDGKQGATFFKWSALNMVGLWPAGSQVNKIKGPPANSRFSCYKVVLTLQTEAWSSRLTTFFYSLTTCGQYDT